MNLGSTAQKQPMNHIVVGVDFDDTGDVAMDQAARTAMLDPSAILHVCHVVTKVSDAMEREAKTSLMDEREKRLKDFVMFKLGGECSALCPRVHVHIGLGDVVDELCQLAVDYQAERIIVGTRARKGLSRITLGSVAKKLVEQAPCAVLVARPFDYEGRPRSPHLEPMRPGGAPTEAPRAPQGRYGYRRDIPLHYHHSSVVPMAIAPERIY
jgi:nucleotide-binding universal stress UspA family protein